MRGDVVSRWSGGGVVGRGGLTVERKWASDDVHCCITRSLCAISRGLVEMRSWALLFQEKREKKCRSLPGLLCIACVPT